MILESIHRPQDVRALPADQLQQLADEVRQRLIDVVSQTGGHIGAGLGVVELTVALCAAFDSPRDKIVWDVGHQGYPWKILTGRNDRLATLRQRGGLFFPSVHVRQLSPLSFRVPGLLQSLGPCVDGR